MGRWWTVLIGLVAVAICVSAFAQPGPITRPTVPTVKPGIALLSPTQRVIVPFTLGPRVTTFSYQFKPVKDGDHTAGANWGSAIPLRLEVSSAGMRPVSKMGPPPLTVEFRATRGQVYNITITATTGLKVELKGEMAVFLGTGDRVSKRPLNPAIPQDASAMGSGGKDGLTPILAQLARRNLGGATDTNELDQVFAAALARHPGVSRATLQKFVGDFGAIPPAQKQARFTSLQAPPMGAVTKADARQALIAAKPTSAMKVVGMQPLIVVAPYPHIDHVEPTAPAGGYAKGQSLVLVGIGFSGVAAENHVEIYPATGGATTPTYRITPTISGAGRLTFNLPAAIAPGYWHVQVVVKDAPSNQVSVRVAEPPKPQPVIDSITPSGQQPSQWVYLNGHNFQPGRIHHIRMTLLDLADPHDYWTTATVESETQLRMQIPVRLVPGQYGIQVQIYNTPNSDSKIYAVGIPHYRIVFTKMRCDDESNPEWWGHDEIVTFWAVVADGYVWKKNTDEYGGFDDGDEKNYNAGDQGVFKTDGNWGDVKYGLALTTRLYEWDAGDVDAVQSFIGFVGDVAGAIVGAIWGSAAGSIVEAVLDFLSDAIDYIASWFGGDPDFLGEKREYWSNATLQSMLGPNSSMNRTIIFSNNGDTGSYRLYYTLYRE